MDQTASIRDWVGRTRAEDDEVTLGAVRRMAATLDQDPGAYHRGSEMPESWYAILFGPTARQGTLGRDGHPVTGDFLPPLHDARRMFAGRRVRFHQPLRVGDRVERVSKVTQAEAKTGRSGAFTLVTIVHELNAAAGVALTEEQDVVYREAVASGPSVPAAATPAAANRSQAGTASSAGSREAGLVTHHHSRSRAADALLGADLQCPPHSL